MKLHSKNKARSPLTKTTPRLPGQSQDDHIHELEDNALGRYYAVITLLLLTGLLWVFQLLGIQPNLILLTLVAFSATIWAGIIFLRFKLPHVMTSAIS